MIEINATFLMQILHFLVMWWILDRFFFRHVVARIQQKESKIANLTKAIAQGQEALRTEQFRHVELWRRYRKKFAQQTPQIETTPALSYSTILCAIAVDLDKDAQKKLVKETKVIIVEKATYHD